ncbi:MAG: caspase family protein [Pseudomonadales bacterium]|nr:caspase family protein [Pseudomonadales bacterium]
MLKTLYAFPFLLLVCTVFFASSTPGLMAVENPQSDATSQYEIVPCLLPARIRKLGNMVYPERRRLVETSALECGLKGGEFTYYDRAAPENSVAFFLPLAEQGDSDAQVSLGDVYQYLFVKPDFVKAALWYQRAAEKENTSGMMRLAQLYEQGNGVAKDGLLATNLWRKATGAGEELVLASELESARTEADERVAKLTQRLVRKNEETAAVRRQLGIDRDDLNARKKALALSQSQVQANQQRVRQLSINAGDAQELVALRKQVAQQKRKIDDQKFDIESLQGNLGDQEAQLKANLRQIALENRRLEKELASVSNKADDELEKALSELDSKDIQIAAIKNELKTAQGVLEGSSAKYSNILRQMEKSTTEADSNKRAAKNLVVLKGKQTRQLAEIEIQRQEIAALEQRMLEAENSSSGLREQLAQQVHQKQKLEARFAQSEAKLNENLGEMESLTRNLSDAEDNVRSLEAERVLIKQQMKKNLSTSKQTQNLAFRLEKTESQLSARETTIQSLVSEVEAFKIKLMDIESERSTLYAMRSPETPEHLPDTSKISLPRKVKIGKYYALVVGNNNYDHLMDLKNAHSDARSMHELLQDEYNFESKLLLDVTKRDLYEAANELRLKVDPNDFVLFYYAGHGYENNSESFWLPVETEKDKISYESQGVSSSTVSKWIKSMPANHVLVIADSCYSGNGIQPTGGFKWDVADLEKQLPFFMANRSRTMLTSGGVAPVMDGDGSGGKHSVFTAELLGLLKENKGVIHGEAMHAYLVERIKYRQLGAQVNQTPQFGMIQNADHEAGQFVFLHRNMQF